MVHGYPVLAKHGVAVHGLRADGISDGLGEAWWLALEAVIARNDRIALVIDREEKRFEIADTDEKNRLYDFLLGWMRSLGPEDLSAAINDLCKRHSVDLAAVSREMSMSWDDLAKLAADPNVTIGSMTVNAPVLTSLKDAAARAKSRWEGGGADRVPPRHHAFRLSVWRPRIVQSPACDAGPRSRLCQCVTALPGVIQTEGRSNLHALPRIAWDGRQSSLRAMRVMLSGMLPKTR